MEDKEIKNEAERLINDHYDICCDKQAAIHSALITVNRIKSILLNEDEIAFYSGIRNILLSKIELPTLEFIESRNGHNCINERTADKQGMYVCGVCGRSLEKEVQDNYEQMIYPFKTEKEWLEYNNQMTDIICDKILNYKGVGKFGGEKLQRIADIILKHKQQ